MVGVRGHSFSSLARSVGYSVLEMSLQDGILYEISRAGDMFDAPSDSDASIYVHNGKMRALRLEHDVRSIGASQIIAYFFGKKPVRYELVMFDDKNLAKGGYLAMAAIRGPFDLHFDPGSVSFFGKETHSMDFLYEFNLSYEGRLSAAADMLTIESPLSTVSFNLEIPSDDFSFEFAVDKRMDYEFSFSDGSITARIVDDSIFEAFAPKVLEGKELGMAKGYLTDRLHWMELHNLPRIRIV